MKLTDTHLIMLSSAAKSGGGIVLPDAVTGSAAKKLVRKLIQEGLIEEVPATDDRPVWRRENDESYTLSITDVGLAAIGAPPDAEADEAPSAAGPDGRGDELPAATAPAGSEAASGVQSGSKRARLIGLLQRPDGTSLDEISKTLGWLPHTSRAAMSGLRKRGFTIDRRRGDSGTIYRIIAEPAALQSAAATVEGGD